MSDDEKPLLKFVAAPANCPIRRKPYNYRGCKHMRAEVDEVARIVTCQLCGAVIDPIQFLLFVIAYFEQEEYKYQKILEFEAKEKIAREKQSARIEKRRQA